MSVSGLDRTPATVDGSPSVRYTLRGATEVCAPSGSVCLSGAPLCLSPVRASLFGLLSTQEVGVDTVVGHSPQGAGVGVVVGHPPPGSRSRHGLGPPSLLGNRYLSTRFSLSTNFGDCKHSQTICRHLLVVRVVPRPSRG